MKNKYCAAGFMGVLFLLIALSSCKHSPADEARAPFNATDTIALPADAGALDTPQYLYQYIVKENVSVRRYFSFMARLVQQYDSLTPYTLTEHLLVQANPWIIDSLASTDYYIQKEKGFFVFDQQSLDILKAGDTLHIPTADIAGQLLKKQSSTVLDLNIPEYRLRVIQGGDTVFSCKVRVGRNERKYLAMAGRVVDLRTAPGKGKIVRINNNPRYINPADNMPYKQTKRDDGKRTLLPRIPWLEPELDGHRYGQMLHPTTNPETLGRAYSNGCIGLGEADAWRLYYYAPLGTKVVFRYDLKVADSKGDTIELKDVYHWRYLKKRAATEQLAAQLSPFEDNQCCYTCEPF